MMDIERSFMDKFRTVCFIAGHAVLLASPIVSIGGNAEMGAGLAFASIILIIASYVHLEA